MQTQSSIRHGHVPTIVADRANNALIILATPAEHARLGALIERLDIRQPQVMLELVLVSLSQDQSMDLGIEIDRLIDGPDDTRGRISSLFGLGANAANQAIGLGGAGLTGVVLSPGEFSIVVRALEAINDGRSLSSPRVLVENNSPATIDAVVEAPFVSTNASNTVATTSFGGTQEAGTQVTVTPHIAQGGHVRLEYAVSLSSFVGESACRARRQFPTDTPLQSGASRSPHRAMQKPEFPASVVSPCWVNFSRIALGPTPAAGSMSLSAPKSFDPLHLLISSFSAISMPSKQISMINGHMSNQGSSDEHR
jgi:type II secretory pathway component GspD/PulD (secretin)